MEFAIASQEMATQGYVGNQLNTPSFCLGRIDSNRFIETNLEQKTCALDNQTARWVVRDGASTGRRHLDCPGRNHLLRQSVGYPEFNENMDQPLKSTSSVGLLT